MRTGAVSRVGITEAAAEVLQGLIDRHGPVVFHQSGMSRDSGSPLCCPLSEFRVGAADVLLGRVFPDTPFWMSADQFERWRHSHLTVDVVPGRRGGFSLEAHEGVRFIIRSRVFTDAEAAVLEAAPAPRRGADLTG
ncbi:DUF779 domain-containing protein [Nocardia otitidiscaviarum]|uniref:DUF779 domain-containing protein n=1 Tax=Nocardia otitidiscaviarum TaxID=1823 RepID=A0A516NKU9_9NOCA|nr:MULTISPECIES: DUF779 domain-containing protein [Nocardia]MBF6136390.1 DUF779 domain-containing protein [Nocardia otitidiscaviarum]MBF6180615.1 DUF779 domain-containing protein [Nocardia otitidiscaviarum]MBF6241360.1 DUF779 domain-containing protein [Nocardia otitidiscaviarum]MBF6484592.1 DUF779 domain-containing protein [Nocardia otitidiscaviarum]MCP9618849.1 DUF779 domain-containing protein [Nocardia otitidiscaviarum]